MGAGNNGQDSSTPCPQYLPGSSIKEHVFQPCCTATLSARSN
jgi:hypothetical protein